MVWTAAEQLTANGENGVRLYCTHKDNLGKTCGALQYSFGVCWVHHPHNHFGYTFESIVDKPLLKSERAERFNKYPGILDHDGETTEEKVAYICSLMYGKTRVPNRTDTSYTTVWEPMDHWADNTEAIPISTQRSFIRYKYLLLNERVALWGAKSDVKVNTKSYRV